MSDDRQAFANLQRRVAELLHNLETKAKGSPRGVLRACKEADDSLVAERRGLGRSSPAIRRAGEGLLTGAQQRLADTRRQALYRELNTKTTQLIKKRGVTRSDLSSLKSEIQGLARLAPEQDLLAALRLVYREWHERANEDERSFLLKLRNLNKINDSVGDFLELLNKAQKELERGSRDNQGIHGGWGRQGGREAQGEHLLQRSRVRQKEQTGCCYLVTACLERRTSRERCGALRLMPFLHHYVEGRAGGPELLERYLREGPEMVTQIDARPDAQRVWDDMYKTFVVPCAAAIRERRFAEAFDLFRATAERWASYSPTEM